MALCSRFFAGTSLALTVCGACGAKMVDCVDFGVADMAVRAVAIERSSKKCFIEIIIMVADVAKICPNRWFTMSTMVDT